MKYIGPFLRINNISTETVQSQLFHFAKESTKFLVLNSRFGITTPVKELKLKTLPNIDINTFKENSPLLCVYKKSSAKLLNHKNSYILDESTFKKEILVSNNAYMTLSILDLADYYKKFENIDKDLYSLSHLYIKLAKSQLDFYSSFMRNEEGVFIDKKDISDDITKDFKFEEKNKKFKFSDQALMMNAFFRYAHMDESNDSEAYKTFSLDILNMLIEYRSEVYEVSLEENIKLCMALNIFTKYSSNEDGKLLLIDLMDIMSEYLDSSEENITSSKLDYLCLAFINLMLFEENTHLRKYTELSKKLYTSIINLYNADLGLFIKPGEKKEVEFSCEEIVLYLISIMLYCKYEECSEDHLKIREIFKRQFLSSGIVLSWPEAPTLNSPERYKNFSLKSDDLIDETDFKMPTVFSPEISGLAPVMVKQVKYNVKKEIFSVKKSSFDSNKNFSLLFYILDFIGQQ